MSRAKAKDQGLYERVVADAKRKFDVWPSIPASSWVVAEYKRRGGKYEGKKPGRSRGLEKWYEEEWVDLARSTDSKGRVTHWVQCTRPEQGAVGYPKCVPLARARSMTPAQRIEAVKRKRKAERKPKRGKGRAPRRAATMNGGDRVGTPMIFAELRGLSSMTRRLKDHAGKERLPTWAEYKLQRAQLNLRGAASKVAYGTGIKLKPNESGYMAQVNLTQIAEDADYLLERLAPDSELPEWMEHIIHAAHADVERVYTRFVRKQDKATKANPVASRWRPLLHSSQVRDLDRLESRLLELEQSSISAYESGDYAEAERLDSLYEHAAEKLEGYIDELEASHSEETESARLYQTGLGPGLVEGFEPPVAEQLAQLWREYRHPQNQGEEWRFDPDPEEEMRGIGREQKLLQVARSYLTGVPGFKQDTSDDAILEALQDAYKARNESLARGKLKRRLMR